MMELGCQPNEITIKICTYLATTIYQLMNQDDLIILLIYGFIFAKQLQLQNHYA